MRQGPLEEGVLVAGRALDEQQPAPASRRLDEDAAAVVLTGDLAGGDRHRHLVDGRRRRIRRDREHRMHRCAIGRRDPPDVDRPAVGGEGQVERLGAESRAERRDVDVDRGVGQARLAGGHGHHFAVAGDGRRPDAHGEDRRRGRVAARLLAHRGVAAVGDDDDAAQRPPTVAIGHRRQRTADVGAAGRGLQPAEIAGGHAVAEGPDVGAERRRQRRHQRLGGGPGPLEPGRSLGVGDAHAARDVDQNRHDAVARRRWRDQLHGPQHRRHQEHQGQRPQRRQDEARARRQVRAGVGVPRQGDGGAEQERVAPPRQRDGKSHGLTLLTPGGGQ